ncbi:MAG: hypothetical protein K940chlam7_00812 [Chlamydiae bacterium]|nr:hypothetical protein [Chlamydiota bacterium]
MDAIIVSTSNPRQENYWQKRLKEMRGFFTKPDTVVIAVCEDWPNGAGNGLGTLYAYYKAQEKARFMYNTDLYEMQKQGGSIVIYHTAGLGKRLFPLTASEFNNKSAIKLPGFFEDNQLTILEAVILQTSHFVKNRPGRLSVFWGDQLFIPYSNINEVPQHHIEILGQSLDTITEEDWSKKKLANYGLLAISPSKRVKLLEKIDYHLLQDFINAGKISSKDKFAMSLGSFSLSAQMTFSLLREYAHDLQSQRGSLDSDPHFWMPLTLDRDSYLKLMSKNEHPETKSLQHYQRMESFKTKFLQLHSDAAFFGFVDIGKSGFWWDYGSIDSYYNNVLKLTSKGPEGQALRLFYQIDPTKQDNKSNRLITDENSCLINCNIRAGKISNSVLIGVSANSIEAENCVIINSNFLSVKANQSLFYHIKEDADVVFSPGTIRADVVLPTTNEHLKIYSHRDRNGKEDWNITLPQNTFSFQEVYEKLKSEE